MSCAVLRFGPRMLSQSFLTEIALLGFLFDPILVPLVFVVTAQSLEVFSEVIVGPFC